MARVKVLDDKLNGRKIFYLPDRHLYFRRLAGAMCWPSVETGREGAVVVLGEVTQQPLEYGALRHDVHVVHGLQSAYTRCMGE